MTLTEAYNNFRHYFDFIKPTFLELKSIDRSFINEICYKDFKPKCDIAGRETKPGDLVAVSLPNNYGLKMGILMGYTACGFRVLGIQRDRKNTLVYCTAPKTIIVDQVCLINES